MLVWKGEKDAVRAAVAVLKRGGVIAFPTETTYGLGCDPRNAKAVAKIYKIKGRARTKSLLLVASSKPQVKNVAHLDGIAETLARAHWPGPLTLVLPVKKPSKLANGVQDRGTVAVRFSSSAVARRIAHEFGFPIVATSANVSGEPDSRSGRAVVRAFQDREFKPDLVIDLGSLPRRKPSTVARVNEDGSIEVRRQGAVRL